MKGFWPFAAVLMVSALPGVAQAQLVGDNADSPDAVDTQFFADDFDAYVAGSTIMGQGGWETWDNNPAADTTVSSTQASSPSNSLLVVGAADIVHQFSGVTSGSWTLKAMTYVPATQSGEMWFILLNTYTPSTTTKNWSVQVVLCRTGCTTAGAVAGSVVNLGGSDVTSTASTPLITGQWVEVRVEVNLAVNTYSVFYNNVLFDTKAWIGGTGTLRIQAMDLFSLASNESYMDNIDTTLPSTDLIFKDGF